MTSRDSARRAAFKAFIYKYRSEYDLLSGGSGRLVLRSRDKEFLESTRRFLDCKEPVSGGSPFYLLSVPKPSWGEGSDFIISLASSYGLSPSPSKSFSIPVLDFLGVEGDKDD